MGIQGSTCKINRIIWPVGKLYLITLKGDKTPSTYVLLAVKCWLLLPLEGNFDCSFFAENPLDFPVNLPDGLTVAEVWCGVAYFSLPLKLHLYLFFGKKMLLCSWDKSLNIGRYLLRFFLKVHSFTFIWPFEPWQLPIFKLLSQLHSTRYCWF